MSPPAVWHRTRVGDGAGGARARSALDEQRRDEVSLVHRISRPAGADLTKEVSR
jgi:hypothetical protein